MQKLPVRLADREDAANLAELPDELRLAMADIASSAREGLLAMSVAVGLRVMGELMDAELATKVGSKGKHDPARTASRHGTAPGSVVLGGRRVPVDPGPAPATATRCSWTPTPLLPPTTCSAGWSWNGCFRGWPPAATGPLASRSAPPWRPKPARPPNPRSAVASSPRPSRRWRSCCAAI